MIDTYLATYRNVLKKDIFILRVNIVERQLYFYWINDLIKENLLGVYKSFV